MTASTASYEGRWLHLPLQAHPIRRYDHSSEEAVTLAGGVEAAGCSDLPDPAREMCYRERYGIVYE